VYVDCTAGGGGHSALIAERLDSGRLIALDRDPTAVAAARERLAEFGARAEAIHANYAQLERVLARLGIASVDGVLIDAGVSSMQLDEASRGFSFRQDAPLDMRMDPTSGLSAAEYLASVDADELARVLSEYGDLPRARSVATKLLARHEVEPIQTTRGLADAVSEIFSFVEGEPEEVRKIFQAIRIAVNDELGGLELGVSQGLASLAMEGRFVAIAFHSGEDRIVKNAIRAAAKPTRILHPDGRVKETVPARLHNLTRRPILPAAREIEENPRAHSARLRAVERVN
jgi:16S rRNA (cytosine1402-N4)-methyltransferase